MAFFDYPIIGSEKELPLYLINMGLQHRQDHVRRPEGYPCPQFLYCTKGSGTLLIDEKRILIPSRAILFLPANYPHEYFANEAVWDIHWVVPGGDGLPTLLSHFGLQSPLVKRVEELQKLEQLFLSLHDSLHCDPLFGNYRAAGILYNFMIEFYQVTSRKESPASSSSAVRKAVEYVDANYRSMITLDDLCAECGVTKQHLCHLFRTTLHARPMEYVAKRKLQAAKELLTGTSMTIEAIAENTGFCSASYFCEVFKRYEGMTPTQFKREL